MAKYLDYPGLSYFWSKIKSWIRNYTHASYDLTTGRTTVVVDNITFDVSHKLPADYAPSTLENDALNPAANDSYDLAFSKIHKAIKDTERVTAEALTDLDSRVNELDLLKAPKASPALTGTPTAPTAASGTNTTQIATTAFVLEAITSALVGAAMFLGIIKSDNVAPAPTALPTTGYKKGLYWIVGTAGTYAGQVCEVGDTVFCVNNYVSGSASNNDFNIVQNNIDTISNSEIDSIETWPTSS